MFSITANNANDAYQEAMELIHRVGVHQISRNGEVISFAEPFLLTIKNPTERVVFNPARDANPFFHVMEAIWMFAGRRDVRWLVPFNARYRDYAEDDGLVHGAYGHRWRVEDGDQLMRAYNILLKDPTSRQVVISMWNAALDLDSYPYRDRPCNTSIFLRVVNSKLDMTVLNRSNDIVWGMLGANVVHMTMLQEVMARSLDLDIGKYRVFSNNAHIYPGMPNYDRIISDLWHHDAYPLGCGSVPLLNGEEGIEDFLECAQGFCYGYRDMKMKWFKDVAIPMYNSYMARKNGGKGIAELESMPNCDWKLSCLKWIERRES